MGYNTHYELEIKDGQTDTAPCQHTIPSEARFCPVCGVSTNSLDLIEHIANYELTYNPFEEICKWYEHQDDMARISKKYPTVLFKLLGEGEASGDLWIKYFKDGKVQGCPAKIEYDDFDENKLMTL